MSKTYLFIILILWSFALSAATHSPVLSVETENRADSCDSIKTKTATASQLAYLQQLKTLRAMPSVNRAALANTAQSINTASADISIFPLEAAKRWAFPTLNQ
ncbi:hypothetical protein [Gelidibacter pelagius]|uniref:Uncharacterized protein n=1 Tax=Gelidibacter pelagius TaxID=2819985 RepID=A0ABS3SUU6_9FLAO|nr:hypothetical protein [Gelidibacter pelagius]MBO3099453.1 hypothetical protein [Gelidibacter pelagius]